MQENTGQFVEHLFRHRAGQMKACLTRIFGLEHLDLVEDAVQDALLKALQLWPYQGIPANPNAWMIQVAKNRALDLLRRRRCWMNKEMEIRQSWMVGPDVEPPETGYAREFGDDALQMVFACCHPAIPRDSQVAMTLRTVGGFSTDELARAFLTSRAAMAQRVVRAKRALREAGVHLEIPAPDEMPARLDAVLEVLYLMFNEGYSAHAGEELVRHDLCREAIRLCELLLANPVVARPRVRALAALFLFQASRLNARTDATGDILRLEEQDRSRWDAVMIARAVAHLELAADGDELTSYHLQAEIAACHALVGSYERTDWARILHCYDLLYEREPSPVVALNRVVAVAHVHGPELALPLLNTLLHHPSLAAYYPAFVIRGDLLDKLGQAGEAAAMFRRAFDLAESAPVRRHLQRRLTRLLPPWSGHLGRS